MLITIDDAKLEVELEERTDEPLGNGLDVSPAEDIQSFWQRLIDAEAVLCDGRPTDAVNAWARDDSDASCVAVEVTVRCESSHLLTISNGTPEWDDFVPTRDSIGRYAFAEVAATIVRRANETIRILDASGMRYTLGVLAAA